MDAIVSRLPSANDPSPSFKSDRPSQAEAEAAVLTLLRWTGDNPAREGLLDTPKRMAKAYREMFEGYSDDPAEILGTTFEEVAGYQDVVIMKDISFFSHCEHHVVPIIGKAHVAYLPDNRVVGLSKIARLVESFARRLQTQESMTAQISTTLQDVLNPRGVAILVEAEHMCMAMRGIRKLGSTTLTTSFTGSFRDSFEEQQRFLALVK
jgi:GTP cyclohydrolase IA